MNRAVDVEYADLLAHIDLFAGMDRVTLAKLAAHLQSVVLHSGETLFEQGDAGDAFYIVAKGCVGAYAARGEDLEAQRVALLGPGDAFGEMALLSNNPRATTIKAEADSELLRLDRARFLELVRQQPGVALSIAATLSRRLGLMVGRPDEIYVGSASRADEKLKAAAGSGAAKAGTQRWRFSKEKLGGMLAALIFVVCWPLPAPAGLPITGWHALVPLIALLPLLAMSSLPEGILALVLAGAWVLDGVVSAPVALAGFASPSWVLVVAVLAVGSAIAASGLLYRFALWSVSHSRAGFAGQVIALIVAGVLLGPAVPNATGRVSLVAPALAEWVEALGYGPRSRPSAGLAMAALVGFGQMVGVFLTSSTTAVLVFAVLPQHGEIELNWLSWAFYAAPTSVLLLVGLIAAIVLCYRPRHEGREQTAPPRALDLQRALLGPPTRNERIALLIGIALLSGFITQPLHGVHPAWITVIALAALAAMRVATMETLRSVNWSFALLFGMLASIAAVFSETEVNSWVGRSAAGLVTDLADRPVLFVAVLTVLCFVTSLVLRWQAAAPLITIALGPVASEAGINAVVVGLVAVTACNGFFMPYQSTTYLALYHGTGGQLFTHAQARPAALAYGVVTLLAMCASVPVWRLMGLL